MNKTLILASNSPRRKELLKSAGFDYTVIVSDYSENSTDNDPITTSVNNAAGKAKTVFDSLTDAEKQNAVVLGADTVVCYDKKILGKPIDEANAENTLNALSGKTHSVITGFAAVCSEKIKTGYTVSEVTFESLSDKLVKDYVKTGLPMDKAGSYGIQDGFPLVKKYSGSFDNIVGLPVKEVSELLKEFGITPRG